MKVFVALCVLAVVAANPVSNLTSEQVTKLREFNNECLDSTKVGVEVVTKARKGEFTEDAKLDDYFTCMFKKCEFIDDNGKLKPDMIKQRAPTNATDEEIKKVINSCAKVESEPKAKVAKLAYKCYLTENKIKYQIFPETV